VDQFYQELRGIQKKERNNATLARVEENFYDQLQEYVDVLKQEAMSDPFSKAPAILKQAQIIATDICQRREKKITEAAVLNIHRSYHLFTGRPQFDLVDTTPLNLTPEEEKFYYSLIDALKNHRDNISLEKLSDDDNESVDNRIIRPKKPQSTTLTPVEKEDDDVLGGLDEIKKEEPIAEDVQKPAEKEIIKPKETVIEKPPKKIESSVKVQHRNEPVGSIEDNPNAFDNQDEFYDFESKSVAKDTELVTMLVFDEIGAIVGVDEKVYGPFRPQDIVTLPLVNAKIFFKNRKGRKVKI
jgi:DNA replication factor GINS